MAAFLAPNQLILLQGGVLGHGVSKFHSPSVERFRTNIRLDVGATSSELKCHAFINPSTSQSKRRGSFKCKVTSQIQTSELNLPNLEDQRKLIDRVKNKLIKLHPELPLGSNGCDDEDMIFWFLKDRKFDVDATVSKLVKAITWRNNFRVDLLTEEMVAKEAKTGKAYLHDSFDVYDRPVVVVAAAKHFPQGDNLVSSQQLCVFLIEKALSRLPPGNEKILGIFDLRNFSSRNADLVFVKFLIDVFFNYYPKRLGEVLFVDAPFIFQPGWVAIKPLLKSYAKLVRFCSAEEVKLDYFTPETVPDTFK